MFDGAVMPMTTNLVATSDVVKREEPYDDDARSQAAQTPFVALTVRERFDWIKDHRGFASWREIDQQAGVGNLISVKVRESEKPGTRDPLILACKIDTAIKWARAAKVSLMWLMTGQGDPDEGSLASFTTKEIADELARRLGQQKTG